MTDVHEHSEFYDIEAFKAGKNTLMATELKELGTVEGQKLLHLQCHFGQDTLSWARLGAEVTGVDLSDKAIALARRLASEIELEATFHHCNIYDTPNELNEQFDIVFTSYGTIGWLPDLDQWAAVIARTLKPNGTFYMADFHPFVWMYDDESHSKITYGYFNEEAFEEDMTSSYADPSIPLTERCVTWNHPIGEIITALAKNGLHIEFLHEHNFSHYDVFPNSEKIGAHQFIMKHFGQKIPYMYSIKAVKV